MATVLEELARLRFLVKNGRGQEKCHVVLIEEEARKRKENAGPKPKTRFQWETDFADGYSELNKGKDRLMRMIPNKQVAITVAGILWNETPEDAVRRLAEMEQPEEAGLGNHG